MSRSADYGIASASPDGATSWVDRSRRGVLVMNKSARFKRSLVITAIAVGTLYAGAWRAEADFIQTDLVSDIPGLAALTDPELKKPWGMSHNATSPIWTSNQVPIQPLSTR